MATTQTTRFGQHDLDEFYSRLEELRRPSVPPADGQPRPEDLPAGLTWVAHTDGACLANPAGPGGWAAVVEADGQRWELWGHLASTTNNRAEVLGVLGALEWVPAGTHLHLRSDSTYTLNVLVGRWKARANHDLWTVVRETIRRRRLTIDTEWVPGHAGDAGNELADELSVLGAVRGDRRELARLRGARRAHEPAAEALRGLLPRGAWEKSFLASVERQLRAGRGLSPKQQAVIDRMRARGAETA